MTHTYIFIPSANSLPQTTPSPLTGSSWTGSPYTMRCAAITDRCSAALQRDCRNCPEFSKNPGAMSTSSVYSILDTRKKTLPHSKRELHFPVSAESRYIHPFTVCPRKTPRTKRYGDLPQSTDFQCLHTAGAHLPTTRRRHCQSPAASKATFHGFNQCVSYLLTQGGAARAEVR